MTKTTKQDQSAALEKAWNRFNKKDFEGALGIFEDLFDESESQEALFGRACALFRCEEYEEALKDLNALIKLEPKNTKYIHTRAMLLGADEKTKESIKDLEKVVSLEPDSIEALNDLGGAFLIHKEYVKANNCFDRCIELDTSCPDAWLGKGLVALEKKEWDQAIEFLNAAIKLDGKNLIALLARAEAFILSNNKQEAQKDIRKIVSLKPDIFSEASGMDEEEKDADDDADEDEDFDSFKLDD